MIVHALSFVVYILTYLIIVIAQQIKTSSVNYYFGWFLDTTTGFISYFCFFLVIWHLGTPSEVPDDATSSGTIEESDIEAETDLLGSDDLEKKLYNSK